MWCHPTVGCLIDLRILTQLHIVSQIEFWIWWIILIELSDIAALFPMSFKYYTKYSNLKDILEAFALAIVCSKQLIPKSDTHQ